MPGAATGYLTSGGALEVSLLGLLAVALMAAGVWLLRNSRMTPSQRERRRRMQVSQGGRMGDAMIIDAHDSILFYSYQVRGVSYTTSQDVSDFKDQLPQEKSVLIGPSGLKYSAQNPANSIVICEEWSGLRPALSGLAESSLKENSHP